MFQFFRKVNEHFAEATLTALRQVIKEKGEDTVPIVWIHDYHLTLAANAIRKVSSIWTGIFRHFAYRVPGFFEKYPREI